MNWEQEEVDRLLRDNLDLAKRNPGLLPGNNLAPGGGATPPKEHKYHIAKKEERTFNGRVYQSKKEAQHAQENDLRIAAGDLSFYLEQVPITLPGNIKYRVDFVEFERVCNTELFEVRFVEVKGYKTKVGRIKIKQTEAIYPIHVEVV